MKIILTPEERKIWVEASRRWGEYHQTNMAMEECAETITAVSHYDRGREQIDKVLEEFGDAFVCVGQVINHAGLQQLLRRFDEDLPEIDVILGEAITHSFGKLLAKLEEDDKNHGDNR